MPKTLNPAESAEWRMPADLSSHDEGKVWSQDLERPLPSARGVLTPAEIEALLRPDLPDDLPIPPEPQSVVPKHQHSFDRPAAQDQEHLEQQFAPLSSKLALVLGQQVGIKASVTLVSAGEVERSKLASVLKTRTGAVGCYGQDGLETSALVCLDPALADAMIAKACGAQGSTGRVEDRWTLSAIDSALLEQLTAGFGSVLAPDLQLQAIETDVPYICSLMPDARIVLAEYRVETQGFCGLLQLVTRSQPKAESTPITTQNIATLPANTARSMTAIATARIARLTVPLSHLTALKAGSTLLLGLPTDQPVEVLSGDRTGPVAFEGEIGRKGNKVAVRITRRRPGVFD